MAFFSWLRNRTSTRTPRRDGFQIRPTASRFRPRLEALEGRWLPSTLTVMNNLDTGAGSLRAAIAAANSGDKIVFAPSLNGQTITLTSGQLNISKNLTIQGPGASHLTISGDRVTRVFEVNANQLVVLTGLTINNGRAGFGGGIWNVGTLTISGCTLSGDSAFSSLTGLGGGIFNSPSGKLTVSQSTLSRDTAVSAGGGIYNLGMLTASGSTLSNNSAGGGGGGGFFIGGGSDVGAGSATATLTNCTLANNRVPFNGGGVFVNGGTTTLTNCTVSLNSTFSGDGGGIYISSSTVSILNLINTIVAGNTRPIGASGPDIFGAVATADHSLVGDGTGSLGIVNGANGNIVGGNGHPVINPLLGPLQNNGGPTQTMALLAGSPAIGHADNSKAPARDQRGLPRIDELGELTDIGAFEL